MQIVNLSIPKSWQALSEKQLRYVYFLMSQNLSADEIKTFCLCRWTGIKVLNRDGDGYRIEFEKKRYVITAEQIAEHLWQLAWLDEIPKYPVRIVKIGKNRACDVELNGVPFSIFLCLDNFYCGYLQTQRTDLLTEMAKILYQASKIHLKPEEEVAVFYWFASLKAHFPQRFKYLFETSSSEPVEPTQERLQTAMDNQIRALTKGDVTKEKDVLNIDTLRALTELNALAREYQELQKNIKK